MTDQTAAGLAEQAIRQVATTPHPWIWDFLDGSGGYMGVFFGEKHPDFKSAYWWRSFLAEELAAMSANAAAALLAQLEEQRAVSARMEADARPEALHTFINAAAGEGFVLDGVDAADLYIALFPERYAAAIASIDTDTGFDAAPAPSTAK